MSAYKRCPACKEPMRRDARTCPHCGHTPLGITGTVLLIFFMLPVLACLAFLFFSYIG